jgi:hypothetical protein
VSAALPGGDPLAEALAAGETPSPDLLVAAGERAALGVGWALAALVGILGGLACVAALAPRITFARLVSLDRPPAALVAYFISSVCETMPLTLDIRHWSATGSNQTIAMIVALTLFAFYAARAGRPLLGLELTAFDAASPETGRRPARTS